MKQSNVYIELQNDIINVLAGRGADFVHFVDISSLNKTQNKGYHAAILLGMYLTPGFIQKVTDNDDYVKEMILNDQIEKDEFHIKETETDKLADFIAGFLTIKGCSAYSQSENNIDSTGFYDQQHMTTPLPHKTIAGLGGLGWIGKNNLLVNTEVGCAISMCSVLTNANFETESHPLIESQCGECNLCQEICSLNAIKGSSWKIGFSRDQMLDVHKCDTCLKCLALCPWTQKYMKNNADM